MTDKSSRNWSFRPDNDQFRIVFYREDTNIFFPTAQEAESFIYTVTHRQDHDWGWSGFDPFSDDDTEQKPFLKSSPEDRAIGAMLGELSGDSLGSLVEFQSPSNILKMYPNGVRDMHDGGTWNTIAGQPTDDGEMALGLARSIIANGTYNQDAARNAYEEWLDSKPFDVGMTCRSGIGYEPNHASMANGALMRVAPIGIFGSNFPLDQVSEWAEQDSIITHPNPVCRQINSLFARAIAYAIKEGPTPYDLFSTIAVWAVKMNADPIIEKAIFAAKKGRPDDYVHQMGFAIIAFQNALYELLHAENLEEGIVDTIMQGGDTDTNAAIAGALLGAVHGQDAIPTRWQGTLANCRPAFSNPKSHRPRPEIYWPVDAVEVAKALYRPA